MQLVPSQVRVCELLPATFPPYRVFGSCGRERAKKLFAVVMDQVIGILGDPDLRLPCDVVNVTFELAKIQKRGDVNTIGQAAGQNFLEVLPPAGRYRPG